MSGDPLTFLLESMEHLPDDPATATDEELRTIAAVAAGTWRHVALVDGSLGRLARRLERGLIDPLTALDEYSRLEELRTRCRAALYVVEPLLSAALEARGSASDRQVGSADPRTTNHAESEED